MVFLEYLKYKEGDGHYNWVFIQNLIIRGRRTIKQNISSVCNVKAIANIFKNGISKTFKSKRGILLKVALNTKKQTLKFWKKCILW